MCIFSSMEAGSSLTLGGERRPLISFSSFLVPSFLPLSLPLHFPPPPAFLPLSPSLSYVLSTATTVGHRLSQAVD